MSGGARTRATRLRLLAVAGALLLALPSVAGARAPADSLEAALDSAATAPPARSVAILTRTALRHPDDARAWSLLPRALDRLADDGATSARKARTVASRIAVRALGFGSGTRRASASEAAPAGDRAGSRAGRGPSAADGDGAWWNPGSWPLAPWQLALGAAGLVAIAALVWGWRRLRVDEDAPARERVAAARWMLRLGTSRGEVARRTGIPRDALALVPDETAGGSESDSGTNFRSGPVRGPETTRHEQRQPGVLQRIRMNLIRLLDGEYPLHRGGGEGRTHGDRTDHGRRESHGNRRDADRGEGASVLATPPGRHVEQSRQRRQQGLQG